MLDHNVGQSPPSPSTAPGGRQKSQRMGVRSRVGSEGWVGLTEGVWRKDRRHSGSGVPTHGPAALGVTHLQNSQLDRSLLERGVVKSIFTAYLKQ